MLIPLETQSFFQIFLIMNKTENNKFTLYNSLESFLPEKVNIFFLLSLVDVKDVNNIIFPFALSYGYRQL